MGDQTGTGVNPKWNRFTFHPDVIANITLDRSQSNSVALHGTSGVNNQDNFLKT